MSAPVQVLLVLDVDRGAPVPLDPIWMLVGAVGARRETLKLSEYGAPRVRRFGPDAEPVAWGALERAAERLVERTWAIVGEAASAKQGSELYICGQAPLPLFAHLAQLLGSRLKPQTLVNRRGDGTWDVLALDAAGVSREPFFDIVCGLETSERGGKVAIFVATSGHPAPRAQMEALFSAEGEPLAGIIEVRTSQAATLDANNAGAAAGQLAAILTQVTPVYPRTSGVALFIAGPASLAYLVGRALPSTIGEVWHTNFERTRDGQAYARAIPAPPLAFILSDSPAVLSHIEVHHIRGLADLALELAVPPEPGQGQWAVILGPNGAGKTTLLRAVALALRNLADPKIWPKGTFATPWRANGEPGPSTIAVQHAGGRTYRVVIQKNGSETFSREPQGAPTPFPVFAYGCRRGSALGGVQREVDFREDDGPEVATLFHEGAPLIHAETWLKEWDGAAAKDPQKNAPVYETVREALKRLLGVDEIVVTSDMQVVVSGPTVGKGVPFAAMSDGFLTTAGWFLDLVARWIELSRKHTGSVGPEVLGRMTGLVLLDELDLHLHPRWQIDVIPRVKKLLPRMSFVVTTHNPLTLVGARPEEIWILSTDGGEVRAERGIEAPMLLTGGQIYSRYFGIRDLYPSEIGEALRRYGFLSGDPLRTDDEQVEMEAHRASLREHGIEPGWEEVPREKARSAPARKRATRNKGKAK